jgi:hypothetical protein
MWNQRFSQVAQGAGRVAVVLLVVPFIIVVAVVVAVVVLVKIPGQFVSPVRHRLACAAVTLAYFAVFGLLVYPKVWGLALVGLGLAAALLDVVPVHAVYPRAGQRRAVRAAARAFEAALRPCQYGCRILASDGDRHVVCLGWMPPGAVPFFKCYLVQDGAASDLGDLITRQHWHRHDLARSVLEQTRGGSAEDLLKKLGPARPDFQARAIV